MLHHVGVKSAVRLQGNQIGFPFPKGIADFCNRNQWGSIRLVTEINRDWVKDIPKDAREGQ